MLLEYLQEYTDRVKPLLDQNELFGKILLEFEKKWESGVFPGWPVGLCFRDNINELYRYYYVFESFAFSSGCIFSKHINILPFVEVNIHQFHNK